MKIRNLTRWIGAARPGVLVLSLGLVFGCGSAPDESAKPPEAAAPAAVGTESTDTIEKTTPAVEDRAALIEAGRADAEARRKALFDMYDTDKNGVLDSDEKLAANQALKAHWAEEKAAILEQYDKNKNGEIDPDERDAVRADRAASRPAK